MKKIKSEFIALNALFLAILIIIAGTCCAQETEESESSDLDDDDSFDLDDDDSFDLDDDDGFTAQNSFHVDNNGSFDFDNIGYISKFDRTIIGAYGDDEDSISLMTRMMQQMKDPVTINSRLETVSFGAELVTIDDSSIVNVVSPSGLRYSERYNRSLAFNMSGAPIAITEDDVASISIDGTGSSFDSKMMIILPVSEDLYNIDEMNKKILSKSMANGISIKFISLKNFTTLDEDMVNFDDIDLGFNFDLSGMSDDVKFNMDMSSISSDVDLEGMGRILDFGNLFDAKPEVGSGMASQDGVTYEWHYNTTSEDFFSSLFGL